MNKSELIAEIATKSGITKLEAGKVIDAITSTITSTLIKGESVTVIGFGTFKINKRDARVGRNPRTGEELKLAAKNVPAFSAGKALKDALN
ncbi:MAG: DNA-binding protein HU [Chlorobiaceae bacterium]|nr:DNA-binding protein HU [Chlorobiaceae bacterium]